MPNQLKVDYVKRLQDSLTNSPHFVLINFGGATHHELEDLRQKLHAMSENTRLMVVKNSLFNVSLKKFNRRLNKLTEKDEALFSELTVGPSALLLLSADWIPGLKAVWDFAKSRDDVTFKIGLIDGVVYEKGGLSRLATIPSFEELLVKIIGSMKSPSARLTNSLKFNTSKFVYVLRQASQKN